MRAIVLLLVVLVIGGFLYFAFVRPPRPSPAPAGPSADRLRESVQRVGEDLNAMANRAATQARPALERAAAEARRAAEEAEERLRTAAAEARPALERARDEARRVAHEAAERVARETATAPATRPE
jgi:hypothetical protein